jgi:hypothetical protein
MSVLRLPLNSFSPNGLQFALDALAKWASTNVEDAKGNSPFLRISGIGHFMAVAGSATVTWPGASGFSNALAVNHGIVNADGTAKLPTAVLITNSANFGINVFSLGAAYTYTTTQFTLQACTVDGQLPANTATSTFAWLAIG